MAPNSPSTSQQIIASLNLRWILIGAAVVAVVWVAFFDSHSLLKRAQWHWEARSLATENERLREDIQSVQRQLEALKSDATIEEIAREEYGMHRPGETIYRVEYDN
jgi:cell division protein FtsB